ncbi:MAG TPA: hypothetical protein DCZ48_09400, partial [Methylococcaceae bacterium]|nr:hypothetical protein [Methylococcaceae bacterium]
EARQRKYRTLHKIGKLFSTKSLIVNQAWIAWGQIAWMRLGKVLKAHEYGPYTLDTGNPCRHDGGAFGLCRFG